MQLPVRTEIRCAIIRPPITAKPVHMECPKTPPTITPNTSSRAAKMIVVNCDRSPHSAKNVIVKACTKMRDIIAADPLTFGFRFATVDDPPFVFMFTSTVSSLFPPSSGSGNNVDTVSFSN